MNGAGTTATRTSKTEYRADYITPMRLCTGCKQRRSHTQFTGASTACKRCVRRAPAPAKEGGTA